MSEKQRTELTTIEKTDAYEVIHLAQEAGRILLQNGAEIFRVEETIDRICNYFGIETVETFVLSNGIFITAEENEKVIYAKVKHIPLSGAHLGIVAEVNDLSREITAGRVSVKEASAKLKEIEKLPPTKNLYQILCAGMGSAAFSYLMQHNVWDCIFSFLIGSLLYVFVIAAKKYKVSRIIINIVGGAIITLLAIFIVNLNLPIQVGLHSMIIGSILPLVPGVGFTNAIRDIADSDFLSGTVRMIDALLVFVYIAIGVGMVLSMYKEMLGGLVL